MGMKWRSPSPVDKNLTLVRPLLACYKAEILEHARAVKIPFRDDATNFSADILRNRVRNELLPLLRKNYQPQVSKSILRAMEIVGAETELVGMTAKVFRSSRGDEAQIKRGAKSEPPHVGCYDELPVAVQRRVLQDGLLAAGVATDFELIEQLRTAAGNYVSVNSKMSVARNTDGKIVLRANPEKEFSADELKIKLRGRAGHIEFGGRKFSWNVEKPGGLQRKIPHFALRTSHLQAESFDADKIGAQIVLRHWRAGDRFQPIGMQSAVKLQDLFVNAKIPQADRRNLIVATAESGEIFWVERLRISENFKLTAETRRKLVWEQSKIAG